MVCQCKQILVCGGQCKPEFCVWCVSVNRVLCVGVVPVFAKPEFLCVVGQWFKPEFLGVVASL